MTTSTKEIASSRTSRTSSAAWRRSLWLVEWAILCFGIAYFGLRALPRAWHSINTDFPNYYVTARLLREGALTDRIYEWTWIQRQKDRFQIDQPVVGFIPHTPFSALVMVPFAGLPPLPAKHAWILVNFLLLAIALALIQSLSNLPWRRILVITVLCFPVYRNLEYGQYYVLLLLLLTLALWLYLRGYFFTAGAATAIAAGLKIFPIFFLLYFLRKKQWRAVAGLLLGICFVALLSIAVFGVPLNQRFITEVLPSALRGEAMDPYNVSASSISSLMHHMFIFEPEWNRHPVAHLPVMVAFLQPLLQVFVLALAILFIPSRSDAERIRLEWCGLTMALLAISTMPASYHFTLLLLPVCLWLGFLGSHQLRKEAVLVLLLFLCICFPAWQKANTDGFRVLLAAPRLYCVLLLTFVGFWLMVRTYPRRIPRLNLKWALAFALMFVLQVMLMIRHQSGLYDSYAWRLPTSPKLFAIASLSNSWGPIAFTAMTNEGWISATRTPAGFVRLSPAAEDRLSQFSIEEKSWVEEAGSISQVYVDTASAPSNKPVINNAEQPVATRDGQRLAFLRRANGRASLWTLSRSGEEMRVVPEIFDVLEMSFAPDGGLIFAASPDGTPALFSVRENGAITPVGLSNARFPSVSPDGNWLAYSQRKNGVWNLWVRDLHTHLDRRITHAQCNDLFPTWEPDSRALDYASDCGRGLWLTALHRRTVLP
jgi:Glycosyltransferase family 87/WD40-like Beta Propeller Repeat